MGKIGLSLEVVPIGIESVKVAHPSKNRKSSSHSIIFDTVKVIDDDEGATHKVKVTFSKPLVNLFKGRVFGKKDKPYDKANINKSQSNETDSIFLMDF